VPIEFEPITQENYREVLALAVPAAQRRFVASNEKSLADAYVWPAARPRLVRHEGEAIGFIMTFPFEQDGRAALNLVRIMIDRRFQRRGLGRAAMERLLDESRTEGFSLMTLSVLPDNRAAISLYQELGFRNVGVEGGELRFERDLDP
jgi:diamine N-acetyltransferase